MMQKDFNAALEAKRLWWKPSSLMVMTVEDNVGDMVADGVMWSHIHKEVDSMETIGVRVDKKGSAATSMAHR